MIGFQEKKKLRKVIYSKLVLVILLLLLVWLGFSIYSIYQKYRLSREGADRIANEVSELKLRQSDLQTKINDLDNDTGMENEIRNKYMMSKEGEKVIVLVDDNKDLATSTNIIAPKSWWQSILDLWSE